MSTPGGAGGGAGGEEGPWSGRRVHFVGVGGAGLSGYARVVAELGGTVSGSDSSPSPQLDRLAADGVLDASIGHAAENVPSGEEVELVYSSAVPAENPERLAARARGLVEKPRAELLAELTGLRRTIAVAGTHGKTTTASMLVHALRAAGLEPGWLVGAAVGDGLANAAWGRGEWLVVEADESDRSMLSLSVEIAVLTNVELDHHAAFASLAELREAFRDFLDGPAQAVIWNRPELLELRSGPVVPYDAEELTLTPGGSCLRWRGRTVRLLVPGAHNAVNASGALEAARLAGAEATAAIEGLAGFRGAARRFQLLGRSARGALVYDDYAHHPSEIAATLEAARHARAPAAGRRLPAASVLAHGAARARVRPRARTRRRGRRARRLPGARARRGAPRRERPDDRRGDGRRRGRKTCLLAAHARRRGAAAPGAARGGRSLRADGRRRHRCARARAGVAMSGSANPPSVAVGFPLARLTTVRTGGAAEFFARAGSEAELLELLAWAADEGLQVSVVGSGSNLLIADAGVDGLVVKLDRDLASITVERPRIVCGAGARLPALAARAARAGLSGIEFGVNIPGTVGGAVRMNANAYGGELERVLEWVQLATSARIEHRRPEQLGLGYRRSNLLAGEIVIRVALRLTPADAGAVTATLAEMRARRHEAQPQGIRTFGSTFKNPEDPDAGGRSAGALLSEAGCNGVAVGGARFSLKHANFIENTGGATTEDVVAVMAEGRRRVLERFGVELEPEVQTLGDVRFPWL